MNWPHSALCHISRSIHFHINRRKNLSINISHRLTSQPIIIENKKNIKSKSIKMKFALIFFAVFSIVVSLALYCFVIFQLNWLFITQLITGHLERFRRTKARSRTVSWSNPLWQRRLKLPWLWELMGQMGLWQWFRIMRIIGWQRIGIMWIFRRQTSLSSSSPPPPPSLSQNHDYLCISNNLSPS